MAEIQAMLDMIEGRRRVERDRHAAIMAAIHNGAMRRRDEQPWEPQHFGASKIVHRPEDAKLWELADNVAKAMRSGNAPIAKWAKGGRKKRMNSAKHPRASKR